MLPFRRMYVRKIIRNCITIDQSFNRANCDESEPYSTYVLHGIPGIGNQLYIQNKYILNREVS